VAESPRISAPVGKSFSTHDAKNGIALARTQNATLSNAFGAAADSFQMR